MYANHKSIRSILLAAVIIVSPFASASAQDAPADPAQAMQEVLDRLKKVEKDQTAILENQQKILEELKNLRVWVRRS